MNVLIIEDEPAASTRIIQLLNQIAPDVKICGTIESVEEAVKWLAGHAPPDLILADIQLSDGLCFEIFKRIAVESPVIFTTAYDEFAIEAFKVNSIDYLLKPIDTGSLETAITKYRKLAATFAPSAHTRIESLLDQLELPRKTHKNRFLVKTGQAWQSIALHRIRYAMIENQLVFLVTNTNNRFVVDSSLDELETQLDPEQFFRINRQMIVALSAIQSIHPYFNSRLKLIVDPAPKEDVLVSRQKVNAFKQWLDQ